MAPGCPPEAQERERSRSVGAVPRQAMTVGKSAVGGAAQGDETMNRGPDAGRAASVRVKHRAARNGGRQ